MGRTINRENIEGFLQYLSSCIESIEVRNKKCILGYMPSATALYTQTIIDFHRRQVKARHLIFHTPL